MNDRPKDLIMQDIHPAITGWKVHLLNAPVDALSAVLVANDFQVYVLEGSRIITYDAFFEERLSKSSGTLIPPDTLRTIPRKLQRQPTAFTFLRARMPSTSILTSAGNQSCTRRPVKHRWYGIRVHGGSPS
jgi:hypothetical protein